MHKNQYCMVADFVKNLTLIQVMKFQPPSSSCLDRRENSNPLEAQVMRGLVHLAITRFKADLPKLLDDDKLLSHTIDEILLFSQELQNQGYPPSYPNLMQILSSEPCFTRWKSLEHQ
ncbi:hypothetical protein AVEN_142436-1, partial [Araneus ventricosus]